MKLKSAVRQAGGAAAVVVMTTFGGQALAQNDLTIVHAAPFAEQLADTSVTISANGSVLAENVEFTQFATFDVPAGNYDVAITPTGASDPAITGALTVEDGTDYTVLAVGDGVNQPLGLLSLVDDAPAPAGGNLNVRVVHAAPFAETAEATEVSIRTAGGTVVNGLVGVPYGVASGFFELPAGTYDLKVASNDGSVNLIDPLPADLPAGADVTVIAIGDGANQPLGILALPIGVLPTRAPVDNSANGWWSTPDTGANEGIIAQPIPAQNRIVGTIYTYASGDQAWYTFDSCAGTAGTDECPTPGAFDGRLGEGVIYRFTGADFAGADPANAESVGVFSLEIQSCEEAEILIDFDDQDAVTLNLARLTQSVPCTLTEPQAE
jgi:hypothetical protein